MSELETLWSAPFRAFVRCRKKLLPWMFVSWLFTVFFSVLMHTLNTSEFDPVVKGVNFFLVGAILTYCMTVSYLKEEPIKEKPELSFAGFGKWALNIGCAYLVLLPPLALVMWAGANKEGASLVLRSVSVLAGTLVLTYLFTRVGLVSPAAVSGCERPFKQGWQLTKGKFWWLFLNSIGMSITTQAPVGIIIFVLGYGVNHASFLPGPEIKSLVTDALTGISAAWTSVTFVLFFCAALRMLFEEQDKPMPTWFTDSMKIKMPPQTPE